METRLASLDDAPLLAGAHSASFSAARWTSAQILSGLSLETNKALVVQEGPTILGFILCQIAEGEAEILTFCVIPSARKRGLGQKLLQEALALVRHKKAKRIFLEVAAGNEAARQLYEKNGFQLIGKRPNYYQRSEGVKEDAFIYTLNL